MHPPPGPKQLSQCTSQASLDHIGTDAPGEAVLSNLAARTAHYQGMLIPTMTSGEISSQ